MRHYHVLSGDHGYMPDRNVVYRRKVDAQSDMIWWKRDCEDAIFQSLECNPDQEYYRSWESKNPPYPKRRFFSGSARSGYYECLIPTSIAGLEYIELTVCYEPDCLEEDNV